MGFFINGKEVDDASSNALKDIRALTRDDDLNSIKEQGIYRANFSDGMPKNTPNRSELSNPDYFTVVVINHDDGQVHQFILSQDTLFYRWTRYGSLTGKWQRLIFSNDLQQLTNRIQALENKIGGVIKGLYIKLFSCFFDNGKVAI